MSLYIVKGQINPGSERAQGPFSDKSAAERAVGKVVSPYKATAKKLNVKSTEHPDATPVKRWCIVIQYP